MNSSADAMVETTAMSSAALFWKGLCMKYPPGLLEALLLMATQLLCFWAPATLLLLVDLTFPKFSNRHKIQTERRQPNWSQIKHCIIHVALNSINGTLIQFFVTYLRGFEKSIYSVSRELPSGQEIVFDLIFACVIREIVFYYVHRALHFPGVYRYIHKQHHQFTAPIAFAAQYAHPVEHLIANVAPIVLPLAFRHAHILTFSIWLGYSLLETSAVHSGYDFFQPPFKANMHDLHHEKFNVNFGGTWFLDYLHGTDHLDWNAKATNKKSN